MGKHIPTRRGYSLYDVSSAMQKAIRRGDAKIAGYFAMELLHSRYWKYVWKRLLIISCEDCYGALTQEIESLWRVFQMIMEKEKDAKKARVFLGKAVLLMCRAKKCRDADHLESLIYDDRKVGEDEVKRFLTEALEENRLPIPDYAFDCHTQKGKAAGKTRADFFRDEFQALEPRQSGFFDHLVEGGGE